jgi:FeS assembly SUF system regulator
MIRISKLTDYGIVLLTLVARADGTRTASELADESRLPLPTVSKILKALARAGMLSSHRGAQGGYALARPPDRITVADVIEVLEGPVAVTECCHRSPSSSCDIERACPVRTNWRRINDVVRGALDSLSLAEMMHPMPAVPAARAARPARAEGSRRSKSLAVIPR